MSLLLINGFWNSFTVQTTFLQIPPETAEAVSKEAVCLSYKTNSLVQLTSARVVLHLIRAAFLHWRYNSTVLIKDHRYPIRLDFQNKIVCILRNAFEPMTAEHSSVTIIYPENEINLYSFTSRKSDSTFLSVNCKAQPSTSCYRFRRFSFDKSFFRLERSIGPGRRLPRHYFIYTST